MKTCLNYRTSLGQGEQVERRKMGERKEEDSNILVSYGKEHEIGTGVFVVCCLGA